MPTGLPWASRTGMADNTTRINHGTDGGFAEYCAYPAGRRVMVF
jgi:hypothetical protein